MLQVPVHSLPLLTPCGTMLLIIGMILLSQVVGKQNSNTTTKETSHRQRDRQRDRQRAAAARGEGGNSRGFLGKRNQCEARQTVLHAPASRHQLVATPAVHSTAPTERNIQAKKSGKTGRGKHASQV